MPNTKSDNLFVKEIKKWDGGRDVWKKQTKKTTPQSHLRVYQTSLQNNQVNQNTPIQKISLLGGNNKALQEELINNCSVIPITNVSMPLAVGKQDCLQRSSIGCQKQMESGLLRPCQYQFFWSAHKTRMKVDACEGVQDSTSLEGFRIL